MNLVARVEQGFYALDGSTGSRLLDATLGAVARAFEAVVRLRNRAYRAGWLRGRAAPLATVCVGNLTAGGSGKTPVVEALARGLAERGLDVAVLSRGYGADRDAGRASRRVTGASPALFGDEPVMLAERLETVPVYVGRERLESAELAARDGARVAVLDDGFQHRRMARDLDLLVVDGAHGFGNGYLLPRGPLREPVSALARANLVLVKVGGGSERERGIVSAIRHLAEDVPVRTFRVEPVAVVGADGSRAPASVLEGSAVVAVCGIAQPARFTSTLRAQGARVVDALAFVDHHVYTRADARRVLERADAAGAGWIVTTAKDAIKLRAVLDDERLVVLDVAVALDDGFDLAAWVAERLGLGAA